MEKKNPTELFSFLSFPLQRCWFLQQLWDKIVALKMHETTFNHSERWIYLLFLTTFPPAKTWQNQYYLHLQTLAPDSPFSHHHSGQRIVRVPVASRRLWERPQQWGSSHTVCGSLPCSHLRAPLALLNSISLRAQRVPQPDLPARSVDLEEDRPLFTSCCFSTHGFPCSDLRKKHGCAQRKKKKDMNLYFSLPASRKDNVFYRLHEIFFNLLCTHGYKLKRALTEKRSEVQVRLAQIHHFYPSRRAQRFPPVSQGGHLHRLVNGSSLNVHTWNI